MLVSLAGCGTTSPTTGDRVRVRNTSTAAIENLVLQYPTDRVVIGSIQEMATQLASAVDPVVRQELAGRILGALDALRRTL